jgi:hypothetical protein
MLPHPVNILRDGEQEDGFLLKLATNGVDVDGVIFPEQVGVVWLPDTNEFITILLECVKMKEPERFLTKLQSVDGLNKI